MCKHPIGAHFQRYPGQLLETAAGDRDCPRFLQECLTDQRLGACSVVLKRGLILPCSGAMSSFEGVGEPLSSTSVLRGTRTWRLKPCIGKKYFLLLKDQSRSLRLPLFTNFGVETSVSRSAFLWIIRLGWRGISAEVNFQSLSEIQHLRREWTKILLSIYTMIGLVVG